jgi:POT family proton-dependent oligopeptide transporter
MFRSQSTPSFSVSPDFPPLHLASLNSVPSALKSPFARTARLGSLQKSASIIIPWDLRFLCFHTVTHSFAPRNPVTPFRSMASALFAQNTRGGGTLAPPGPFPLYPLRSPRVRTATPATPILSYIYFTFLWIPGGWGSAPILIASASPIPQASFARCLGTQDSRITGYGSRYTDHGFTAPFNFRLLALSVVEGSTLQVQSPRSIPEPTSLGGSMSVSLRLQEIRDGFERPFWVANVGEIFERLSYYGAFSSLAVYLQEKLNFSTEQTGTLTGIFGGMVWFLAIFGGAVADKLGFRRALSMAYLILAAAYFLIGSIGASWLAPVRGAVPLGVFVGCILILPALGIALVKPCVVGTTARASQPNVRTLGYSIYYTMVNIGGTAGPFVADWAHTHFGLERVFRISALSVFAMFFLILFFFRDPRKPGDEPAPSLLQVVRNFRAVIWPPRFLIFLLIFTGYWIVFWQQYTSLPGYIHTYVNANARVELILITDAAIVVCLTFVVNYLARKIPPFHAVILGTVVSSASWLVLAFWPTVAGAVVSIAVLALGEIIQQPPYYAYISRLAPPGQQGTYMGFAFLPIGIGSLVGGWFGGTMMHHFGEVAHHPERAWWAISAVGFTTALLLWIYDRAVKPAIQESSQ